MYIARLLVCTLMAPLVWAQYDSSSELDPDAESAPEVQPQKERQPSERDTAVTGRVVMWDGGTPPNLVKIEDVCTNGSVRAGGYTDPQGRFRYESGTRRAAASDASLGWSIPADWNRTTESSECSPQPALTGYRSFTYWNGSEASQPIATIVLYPLEDIKGSTESATGLLAPKAAQTAFNKGKEAARKNKLDEAEKQLRKAVELHPKYAAAWYELGRVAERRQQWEEARVAHRAAVAADPKYVTPRVNLYLIAHRLEDWAALERQTSELLKLNPFEYPDAYYYNAVALLRLRRFEEAEDSAREAIHADHRKLNPKTHYVLGAVLASRKQYRASAVSLREFLAIAPKNDPSIGKVRELLALVDAAQ